jgi:hypothetical protein
MLKAEIREHRPEIIEALGSGTTIPGPPITDEQAIASLRGWDDFEELTAICIHDQGASESEGERNALEALLAIKIHTHSLVGVMARSEAIGMVLKEKADW